MIMPKITAQQANNQIAMALWSVLVGVVDESSKLIT
jgi:hypothetical protein